ncbi:PREDICTED: LOW QUALITY PROTEIN: uncharacterized protein LOC108548419 [Eufriesea mexicana]|uniref:LOW QUALITY PROTEIN: uncharacterized protein LOC108548419 n=1 Tax=Eufriesea mexicana TaxID=516756 RepID=UPI00083BF9B8|nr:PREDICTED: LOW QUALITY PROTEIN: uncharacterized protein LOC108548419 [Eufriesea mexicana]
MKKLIVIALMAVVVTAYKNGRRNSVISTVDFPPYQRVHGHLPFHERHHPFREQSFKTQPYKPYHYRPHRQDTFAHPEQLSVRDQMLLREYAARKNLSFFGNRDAPDFHGQSPISAYRNQRNEDPAVYRNGYPFRHQMLDDRHSSYRQSFRDDVRFTDLYDKPINFYKGQLGQQQVGSLGRDAEYLKHGNHGLGYAPVLPISPYENALPFNEEAFTTMTPSMVPTTTHKPSQQSTASSVAPAISQVHTSATSEPKMASSKVSYTATMPTVKSDTLPDAATTSVSMPAISTIPTTPVTTKQSSNLAHSPTTEASLPVMTTESPIISFGRHIGSPIEFQTARFISPTSYYLSSGLKNKLQQPLFGYMLSQKAKDAIKNNEQILLQPLPDALNNSLNNKIYGTVMNYVLPEESKAALKNNLQSSLWNYLLQQESNHGLHYLPSSLSETANHLPLASVVERPKMALPSVPIATLSAVSRPMQTINYLPITLPRMSAFMAQDASMSPGLPLGTTLSSGLASSVAGSQVANVFNSLPACISSLNFDQNFQHVGQMRQFEPTRSQSYFTGLQFQLGDYGGLEYMRPTNPVPRSTNLGIAKLGLNMPELSRHHFPTFSKAGYEQHLW